MADGFVGVAASRSVSVEDWASSSGSRSNDDVTGEGASRGSLLEEGILASVSAVEGAMRVQIGEDEKLGRGRNRNTQIGTLVRGPCRTGSRGSTNRGRQAA